jgi:zinc protease
MVDTPVSGTGAARCGGSNPPLGISSTQARFSPESGFFVPARWRGGTGERRRLRCKARAGHTEYYGRNGLPSRRLSSTAVPIGGELRYSLLMLPPPLAFRRRVLDNGLVVLTHESHKSPTVAIQVWYKVGAKDDPAGKSGFAHLFEHLMFKRSRNLSDEQLDRLTEDVGGENNAYTTPDTTVYHEVVPSNHLERLLWAEADRMASLQVDEANFFSERDVVKEEYRQGVLADPYGRLDDALEARSWSVHPYQRPVIGNIAELDAATLDDVRAFHATFYRPDNAVLVVTGDFAQDQCDQWINRYFGRITRPETAIPRVTVKEPARKAARRLDVHGPSVPLPALALSYLVPSQRHKDAPALQMLDSVLSGGEAARFHQSLIYKQQLASDATTGADLRTDAGMFTVHATTAGGKSLETLLKATLAELEKVKNQPVSAAELARARTRLLAGALHQRETAEGIAGALGGAEVLLGSAQRVDTELADLLAVTAADIQRVARTYLTETNSLLIRYTTGKTTETPLSPKKTAPKETPPPPEEQAPMPSSPRPAQLPAFTDRSLANGLRVVHAARPGSGLVTLELVVPGGAGIVPAAKAGLAALTATLLTRGTTTGKTAPQLAAESEALGGSLSAAADWDSVSAGITTPASNADAALVLLAAITQKPAFATAEVARAKAEAIDEVTQALEEPSTLARSIVQRLFFGQSAYGNRLGGLPGTLTKLTRRYPWLLAAGLHPNPRDSHCHGRSLRSHRPSPRTEALWQLEGPRLASPQPCGDVPSRPQGRGFGQARCWSSGRAPRRAQPAPRRPELRRG